MGLNRLNTSVDDFGRFNASIEVTPTNANRIIHEFMNRLEDLTDSSGNKFDKNDYDIGYIKKTAQNMLTTTLNTLNNEGQQNKKRIEAELKSNKKLADIDSETGREIPIEYIPTQEQQVSQLTAQNDALTLALSDVIGGVDK